MYERGNNTNRYMARQWVNIARTWKQAGEIENYQAALITAQEYRDKAKNV